MESWDVDFSEDEFSGKGDVNKNLELYEFVDEDEDAPSSRPISPSDHMVVSPLTKLMLKMLMWLSGLC